MTYEIYRYIYIGAAILSGVMLLVSILLFAVLRIPRLISDLSGATARKAIKNIREQNEKSGDKAYKVSPVNKDRGKLTDKISSSGRVMRQSQTPMPGVNTLKIGNQPQASGEGSDKTTVLSYAAETDMLNQESGATTVLAPESGATTVLPPEAGATTVLSSNEHPAAAKPANTNAESTFKIEFEITYIHTDEIIEGRVTA